MQQNTSCDQGKHFQDTYSRQSSAKGTQQLIFLVLKLLTANDLNCFRVAYPDAYTEAGLLACLKEPVGHASCAFQTQHNITCTLSALRSFAQQPYPTETA